MKKLILLILFLISSFTVFSSEQSEKLCNCLKEGKASGDRAKLNRCLILQEELVKELGEGSPEHKTFKKEMQVCEQDISSASRAQYESKNFKEKVADICGCAEKSKGNQSERMKCMMLQDQYSKTFEAGSEDKRNFLNETNNCF
jgi:hypothetical protein